MAELTSAELLGRYHRATGDDPAEQDDDWRASLLGVLRRMVAAESIDEAVEIALDFGWDHGGEVEVARLRTIVAAIRGEEEPLIRGVVTVYRGQRVVGVELLQIALAWGRQRLDLYADDPIEASCVRKRIAALEAAIGEG